MFSMSFPVYKIKNLFGGLFGFRQKYMENNTIRALSSANCSSLINSEDHYKMQTPVLYGDEASPPVRFVQITASILDFKMDFHKIDLFKGDNKSALFKKINPLQKVPALALPTEDSVIADSHAIALFMIQKTKQDTLYPSDILKRSKVNEILFFNASALFPMDSLIFSDYFSGKWPTEEQNVKKWFFLLDHLEDTLTTNIWLCGEEMTLGDICCATTVSSLQLLIPILVKYPKIKRWMNQLDEIPSFRTINMRGLERLNSYIDMVKN